MAKTICTVLGVLFILIGIIGFAAPGFIGAHLSFAHNLIHLISGGAALYFGTKGSLSGAKNFCIIFGAVYFLLGVSGFLFGSPGMSSAGHTAEDSLLLVIIPGALELGLMDHLLHVVLGLVFLAGGFMTKIGTEVKPV